MLLFNKLATEKSVKVVKIENKYFNTKRNQISGGAKNAVYDPFFDILLAEISGKEVYAYGNRKNYTLYANKRPILVAENGNIVGIEFETTTYLPDNFLYNNTELRYMNMPNLQKIDDLCLHNNQAMQTLYLNKLQYMGKYFMSNNKKLHFFQGKELINMRRACFKSAKDIIVDTPKIEAICTYPHSDGAVMANKQMQKKLVALAEYNAEVCYLNQQNKWANSANAR